MSKKDDLPFWQLLLYSIGFPMPFVLLVLCYGLLKGETIVFEEYLLGYLVFAIILFFLGSWKNIGNILNSISRYISAKINNYDARIKNETEEQKNQRYLKSLPTIKSDLLTDIIGRSIAYCLAILATGFIIIRLSTYFIYRYLIYIENDLAELKKLIESGNLGRIETIRSFLKFFLFIEDNGFLIAIIISFFFIWFYTSKNKRSIICPHCLKTILFKDISNIDCLLCDTIGHSRFELLLYCSSCRDSIDYFNCPHCQHSINIRDKYDHQALVNKRRDNARLKPTLLTGLRELYNRKKRLPQFICKHCLKVLIAKNYNLTCPHCNANYLVTDNRTQVQVGDVKINNYRYIGDESTMEKLLFDSCVQCGGIIEVIECYHNDCKKDIDLLENYNEVELLKRRYGKD